MTASEQFPSGGVSVKAMHLSDGVLRMIGILALVETPKSTGIILLEEIENGINPHIAKLLSQDLKNIPEKKNRQIVVTTHSSVLLDYFPEESVVFIWRDENGKVHGNDMFAGEEIRESLEYMYPGKVWLNMDQEEIVEKLQTT